MPNPTIIAKRSFRDRSVKVQADMYSHTFGASIKISASQDISTDQARELAEALIAIATEADTKAAKKEAAEARRREWRDREVAAGRMKVVSLRG